MPASAVSPPAISRTSQIERWMPTASEPSPTEPRWKLTWLKWREANQAAVYAPTA